MISQRKYEPHFEDLAGQEPEVLWHVAGQPLWSELSGFAPFGGVLRAAPSLDVADAIATRAAVLRHQLYLFADSVWTYDANVPGQSNTKTLAALPVPRAFAIWDDDLFVSSPRLPLTRVTGVTVEQRGGPYTSALACWFNHLFAEDGTRVRWSQLNDPWTWEPARSNEADFVDLERPVYGLFVLGEVLVALQLDRLIGFQYVGLPRIVQWQILTDGVGGISGQAFGGALYFYDHLHRTFWVWSGQLEEIGRPVRTYLTGAPSACWADPYLRHVFWTFGQRTLAFDTVSRTWYQLSYPLGALNFLMHVEPNPTWPVGMVTQAPEIPPDEAILWNSALRLVGSATSAGFVLKRGSEIVPQRRAVTKWLPLGNIDAIKEVDILHVFASGKGKVSVISTNDVYATGTTTEVGAWAGETVFSFPRIAARYFRFVFEPSEEGRFDGFVVGFHERGARH